MNDPRILGASRNPVTDHLDLWTSALLVKSTAGRGSNGRLEAYGIKKLRDLILGAALRGLFAKDSEALSETIERDIKNARSAYLKSIGKKSKDADFGPPLLSEFQLPRGWKWKRVSELCDLQTGATPNTQRPEYFGGDIRWLVSGDINQGVIEECEGRITEQGLANSNCKILPPGTVLIALNGQGKTRASVALLTVPAACNQSLVGMIPFAQDILDPKFLLLSLRYRYFEIRDITGQNQRRGLNMGLVSELSIPLPPLTDQHRIVAKVDELMALCDQLEQQQGGGIEAHQTLVETLLGTLTNVESAQEFAAAWNRIAGHFDTLFTTDHSIDQLKQTILQLAVMGKLVPQDPKDESSNVLLKRIAKEKDRLSSSGEIRRKKSLSDIGEAKKSLPIPESWEWVRFGDIAYQITDGAHHTPTYLSEGVPFLSVKDMSAGKLDFSDTRFISRDQHDELTKRCNPQRGDLLLTKVGTTGIPVLVDTDKEFSIFVSVALIKFPQDDINGRYLSLLVSSPLVRKQSEEGTEGIGNKNLVLRKIAAFVLPIPPLSEQCRIVAKVDQDRKSVV